jgi:hypothetical protein
MLAQATHSSFAELSMRRLPTLAGFVLLAGLVALDVTQNRVSTLAISPAESLQDEPLQVEGLPLLRPSTLTLGSGTPTVAIAASIDEQLPEPAPLDAMLSYDQVDAIVRRALDLDQSGRSIRDVIEADDWVVIKVNSVTNIGRTDHQESGRRFFHQGIERYGQVTDLRVVKSVIGYLVEHVGPRRITIAEGGSSPRKGEVGFPDGVEDDMWSCRYPAFDNLSYLQILADFESAATVVDTSDLNYAPYRKDPVPGGAISRTSVTRLTYPGAQYGFHVDGTGSFRDGFYVAETILDADKVISIPAMKTTIYGTTLVIKNYVGTLSPLAYGTGLSKGPHAANNPEQGYVDLFAYNPAAYSVVEGFWSTEGQGPQQGDNVRHNLVVVGSDPVATEAIANVTMGYDPLDLEHLYLAAAKGLGTLDRQRIRVVGRDPESVRRDFRKSTLVRAAEGRTMFYGRGIRRWLVAGPFPGADPTLAPLADEARLQPREGDSAGEGAWLRVEHLGYSAERLRLDEALGREFDVSSYAYSEVHSKREQSGFVWFGFDDYARVWWNGEEVFTETEETGFHLADVEIPVQLRRGVNRLLVKVGNRAGRHEMAAHVVDADGDRLPGIQFALPGDRITAVDETGQSALPGTARLLPAFPNPFNAGVVVRFEVAAQTRATVDVHSVTGQRVRRLHDGDLYPGAHRVTWDGRDAAGREAASGVYLLRLTTPAGGDVRRVTLLR